VRFVSAADSIHAAGRSRHRLLPCRICRQRESAASTCMSKARMASGAGLPLANPRPNITRQTRRPTSQSEARYMLYLPLYNGVSAVEIGTPKGQDVAKAPSIRRGTKSLSSFYGTSITQERCRSAGMVHTAILGRWFNRPVINLGSRAMVAWNQRWRSFSPSLTQPCSFWIVCRT